MKFFANGKVAYVFPLTFGRGRISIGNPGDLGLDDSW